MGNNSSRKGQRRHRQGGQAAHTLSKIEELRGPSVDSYDKLIAWLAEMAENDNVELDTSVFVKQLSRVCADSKTDKRGQPIRQNSASCESHASHASSGSQRKSLRSVDECNLDPRFAFRQAMSRQGTYSDDLEEENDDLEKASMESLYSGSDRDSELESIATCDSSQKSGRHSDFKCPLVGKYIRTPGKYVYSSSLGELDRIDKPPNGMEFLNGQHRKSVSLFNLSPPTGEYIECEENQPEPPAPVNDNNFLDDKLLDGNIADILFSVEALWGK